MELAGGFFSRPLPAPEIIQLIAEPLPQVQKPAFITPAGPKSERPPVPEENWTGFYQPPTPGFGRIRASHAGVRNREGIWCFHKEAYVEHGDCMDEISAAIGARTGWSASIWRARRMAEETPNWASRNPEGFGRSPSNTFPCLST